MEGPLGRPGTTLARSPRTVLLDLDGTLLYYQCRLFRAYEAVAGPEALTAPKFFAKQAAGVGTLKLLRDGAPPHAAEDFFDLIESEHMLKLDSVIPGVRQWLWDLSGLGSIVIVTKRRREEAALLQLSALGIHDLVDDVLFVEPHLSKAQWIEGASSAVRKSAVVIGDQREDMGLATSIGARSVGVLSGVVRTSDHWGPRRPDLVLPNVIGADLARLSGLVAASDGRS